MTQEEKDLLLKDLCARLPYGVKVGFKDSVLILKPRQYDISTGKLFAHQIYPESSLSTTYGYSIHYYHPYLRPMSSMTEEEIDELKSLLPFHNGDMFVNNYEIKVFETNGEFSLSHHLFEEVINFYNQHHFDYRGLIPMGLALEAKEDMYKTD